MGGVVRSESESINFLLTMGGENVAVVFDNPMGVYFAGQTVRGEVRVSVTQQQPFDSIDIVCDGTAKVHFTRSGAKNRTNHYRAEENYFHQRIPLFQTGGQQSFLNYGNYQYPFAFILPTNIPTSFESPHGKVRYTIKVVVKRQKKSDRECKVPFTVNSIVDLNNIQEASMPTGGTNAKTLGFLCCKSKPITSKAWIDHIGYVPGQKIMFNARVDNPNKKRMRGSKVQLIEYVTCYAQGMPDHTERVLAELEHPQFAEVDEWNNVPIPVPPVAASGLPFCHIIEIAYRLKFSVDPRAMSTNLVVPLNILIGNVPLRSQFASFDYVATPSAPSIPTNDGAYQNLPPPTYAQATFGGAIADEGDPQDAENGAAGQFNPCYVTYKTSDSN